MDTGSRLVGTDTRLPIVAAPMAYQRLFHPDGELALGRAAADAEIPYVVSTLSSTSIEEIAGIGGPQWFQLYWLRDEQQTLTLVRRAEAAGCRAVMLTVDVPIMGRRLRDVRNRFALPADVRAANLDDGRPSGAHDETEGSAVARHTSVAFAPALTWRHVERLRAYTPLPLIIKGILDPRDARSAIDAGADAVVVSNHGGRQLDGAVSSITALPAVVDAAAGQCEVLLDSGVRSGTDVLKALALGATGVLVGRPLLWGLAAGGEQGTRQVLALLATELQDAMMLSGCADLAAVARIDARRGA